MRKNGPVLTTGLLVVLLLSALRRRRRRWIEEGVAERLRRSLEDRHLRRNAGSRRDLVYDRQAETQTLDPLNIRNGNGDIFAYNLIYSGLVRSDPTGSTTLEPSLAQRWTVSPDGKTYTFFLRPNLKFSNGQPVTAEDVQWSLDRFGNPKIDAAMSSVAGGYCASPASTRTRSTRSPSRTPAGG